MSAVSNYAPAAASNGADDLTCDFVTMTVAGQAFGIPVLSVRDVLAAQRITHVPLARPEIAGSLNLRGRIATAVDMRRRLGVEPKNPAETTISVVVECEGELYSLVVDEVGDVITVSRSAYEPNPVTLDTSWRDISGGLYRLDGKLLVVLEVDRLISSLTGKVS
jgi:purine-binding chemotaxis protein CheW